MYVKCGPQLMVLLRGYGTFRRWAQLKEVDHWGSALEGYFGILTPFFAS